MDKIWYRNHSKSEVIGRCDGDEKTEWPRRTDKKTNAKKIKMLLKIARSVIVSLSELVKYTFLYVK